MPHVDQGLLTHPQHMSSPQVLSRVRIAQSLVFCVIFYRSLFVLFRNVFVLSFQRFTVSDYTMTPLISSIFFLTPLPLPLFYFLFTFLYHISLLQFFFLYFFLSSFLSNLKLAELTNNYQPLSSALTEPNVFLV